MEGAGSCGRHNIERGASRARTSAAHTPESGAPLSFSGSRAPFFLPQPTFERSHTCLTFMFPKTQSVREEDARAKDERETQSSSSSSSIKKAARSSVLPPVPSQALASTPMRRAERTVQVL